MSEAMNPRNPGNPMNPGDEGSPTMPRAYVTPVSTAAARPGLVTFAAFMLFLLAGFQVIWAIEEFVNAVWLSSTVYGTFNGYLWLWAIFDLLIAAITIYAGYDILRGGEFGRIFGVVIAGISALRWFFYLPAAPLLAIVVIAVDILIIYGLVVSSAYFRAGANSAR